MKNKDKKVEPFFARFLEGQFPKVKSNLKVGKGPPRVTLKYPSDDDEGGVPI